MNKYQSYKPSGVEWVGEIPEHWCKTKITYYCKVKDGTHDTPNYVDEGGYPLVTQKDITNGKLDFSKTKNISEEDYFEINKRSNVEYNDIIMSMIGSIGNPTIVDSQIKFSIKNVCLFKSSESVEVVKYIHYFLDSQVVMNELQIKLRGGVQGFVSLDVLRNLIYLRPPKSEQLQIVLFLDEKTELIDKLISTKERKITLLKEQRTSLINQVVTKGLNPNVKMKDSGVEWIGEIPEHWVIKKTKHIRSSDKFSLVDGPFGSNLKSEHYVENGDVYIIESGFITSGKFKFVREFKTISKEHFETIKRSECFEGCIIMSKIGEYYGMSGILPKLDKLTVVSGNCISIKVSENHNTRFIHNVLIQHWKNGTFKKEVQQTGQPFISMTMVDNISFPIPPLNEQNQIVEHLDSKTKEIDDLVQLEQKKIDLLKEYRQSLISEVVTGKIKVTQ